MKNTYPCRESLQGNCLEISTCCRFRPSESSHWIVRDKKRSPGLRVTFSFKFFIFKKIIKYLGSISFVAIPFITSTPTAKDCKVIAWKWLHAVDKDRNLNGHWIEKGKRAISQQFAGKLPRLDFLWERGLMWKFARWSPTFIFSDHFYLICL